RGKEIHILWSESGTRTLPVQARKDSLPVYDMYGKPLKEIDAKETPLEITESPLYIEGRLLIGGS
ncbi:MAG: hypothetical protein KY468_03960, partial [Armatimonadetes bacterium]|nr:hypothetical protein [Armatimonadota bacterium]